jgi:hypothetical protein
MELWNYAFFIVESIFTLVYSHYIKMFKQLIILRGLRCSLKAICASLWSFHAKQLK